MADYRPNMTDYEAERREFKLDVPEHFNFGFDVIDKWAEDRTKLALISVAPDGESAQKHTFWDLKVQSNKFANLLARLGVEKGERAFFMGPRVPEWYVATLGMIKAGVIPMPATTLLTPHDIEYRVTLADATVAIVDLENAHKVEEVVADCPTLERIILLDGSRRGWTSWQDEMDGLSASYEPDEPTRSDDDMIIYFTSGTVGQPKMVLHTQASYAIAHVITARFWHDLKSTDVHWAIADTGWAKTAYGKLFGQWTEGAAVLQHNAQGRFNPDLTLRILTRYGVSAFCAPPTVYRMMVLGDLSKYDLSSLSHCTGAGEPLNPEVIKQWEDGTGHTIYDGYGQTETVLLVGNYRCMPVKPGSMGLPTPGFDVAVIDEDGAELGPNKEGQIAVRVSPERPVGLMKEYWRDKDAMDSCMFGDWYLTGDKAYVDEDGYYWFVGRVDDLIISAGYRIGPFEVESALIEHPAVAESAVVASPDEIRGSIVKAFVVLAPGYVESDELTGSLQAHVRSVTAPYKYPRALEYVSELPKTISGKIRRVELRQREVERARS